MKTWVAYGLASLSLVLVVLLGAPSTGTRALSGIESEPPESREVSPGVESLELLCAATPTNRQYQPFVPSLLSLVEAEKEPQQREDAMQRLANSVPDTHLRTVLNTLLGNTNSSAAELCQFLTRRWAESDPSAAALWAEGLADEPFKGEALRQVAIAWANADLAGAIGWAEALPEDANKHAVALSLAYETCRTDPPAALEIMRVLPASPERDESLVHAVSQWAAMDSASAQRWALSVPDARLREHLMAAVAVATADQDGSAAAVLAATALAAGSGQECAAVAIAQRWAQKSPHDAASWVAQFPDGLARSSAVRSVAALWTAQDREAATAWLRGLPEATPTEQGAGAAEPEVRLTAE